MFMQQTNKRNKYPRSQSLVTCNSPDNKLWVITANIWVTLFVFSYLGGLVNPILHGDLEGLLLVVQVVVPDLALRPPVELPDLDPLGGGGRLVVQVLVVQFALHVADVRKVVIEFLQPRNWNYGNISSKLVTSPVQTV